MWYRPLLNKLLKLDFLSYNLKGLFYCLDLIHFTVESKVLNFFFLKCIESKYIKYLYFMKMHKIF